MADQDPRFQLRPQSKFPWPLIAIVAAAIILGVFVALLPRTPKRGPNATAAEVPPQPFGDTLQLTHLKVQPSPTAGSAYVQGTVANTGAQKINGVTVVAKFKDPSGAVVYQDTVPMQALPNDTGNTVAVSLEEDPLAASSTREFRLAFDSIPRTWNHEAPSLEIAHISFAGQPPAQAQGDTKGVQTGAASGGVPASDVVASPIGKPAPGHEATKKTRRARKAMSKETVPTNPPL